MSEKEIGEKIKELMLELIKSKVSSKKGGKIKVREIKKTIARLKTANRLNLIKDRKKATENDKIGKSKKTG